MDEGGIFDKNSNGLSEWRVNVVLSVRGHHTLDVQGNVGNKVRKEVRVSFVTRRRDFGH